MKKIISVILVACLLFSTISTVSFAGGERVNYIIENPYEGIDWDTINTYKAQFHCHTTASDGYQKIGDAIPLYYDNDYDILAITDHGTLNKGWNVAPDLVDIMRLVKKERTNMEPVVPLSEEDYLAYTTGTATPSQGFTRTHNTGMLDVPLGIELNMATPIADCHLTGYWSDYGQGLAGVFGDYETPSRGVARAGGISFLSHVGEFVYTDKNSADHVGQKVPDYYATKFARLFMDNQGSSAGMGINSACDEHTRCDRILYDQVLQKTIPNGVVPWGFTFSDSHEAESVNRAYTMMLMPELTEAELKKSMLGGTFFSVSHYSYGVELNGMEEMPGFDPEKVDLSRADTPIVTKIAVDGDSGKIHVEGENFNMITWVSNGNVLLRQENITDGKATLDLYADDLLASPELYVRFYIVGENGICYAQPMVLKVQGRDFEAVEVPQVHDTPYYLRKLVTVLDWLIFKWNPVVWAFKYFALGYNPIKQAVDSVSNLVS